MARYGDLDPATRAAVDRAMKGGRAKKERKRARPSRAELREDENDGWRYRCECGQTFATYSAAGRHPAGPGHGRIELLLEGEVDDDV